MEVQSYLDAAGPVVAFLRNWAQRGEVLVVSSTRASVDDLVRSACDGALTGVHKFTLRELAMTLGSAAMNQRGLTPVRRIAREALAALATSSAIGEKKLAYLGPVAQFPGFPRALARTLERLRLNRVSLDSLRNSCAAGPDLAALLEIYERELRDRSLVDHAARVMLALEALRVSQTALAGMPLILFDVRAAGQLESELLESLRSQSAELLEIELGRSTAAPDCGLRSLQAYVLSGETVPDQPPDDTFELFSASGEALECVEIARRISAAARAGVPFDQMAVLLRSPGRYQPMVAEALRRAGIPAFFARASRRPDASGRAFLALLRCAEENYSASAFAEYLSLGQMPSEDGETRAPASWERLLVDAAVIGGRDRWQRRLDGVTQEYLARYEASDDPAERSRCARFVEWLESLAGFALPLIERLERLPRTANWGEWIDPLYDLASVTLRHPDTVHELMDELEPMAPIGPVTLLDVLDVLREHLTELRGDPEHDRYGKVFVGGIEETQGMSFRHVYVPALNEGIFPRPAAEDPLLLDQASERLGINVSRDDNELLRICTACASERIVMSWSRLDLLTGRERVPSFYAFEALKAARGSNVDIRNFEAESRGATETRIGWPAPADPSAAIDDLEYDLAYLRPAWLNRAKGEGGYLTKVNPHVVRCLRARWLRWKKPWRWADGFVDLDTHALTVLDEHRPSKRAWSVSALQQYARCPYRFALRGIYGLEPAERPHAVQRIDPATRGRIYHQAQFQLLQELSRDGLLPLTANKLPECLTRLRGIIQGIASGWEELLAPAIRQVWDAGIEAIHADLRGWLRYKAALETEWTPEFFELSFGLSNDSGKHDVSSRPKAVEALPGLFLRGSIDVVERHASGMLRVVDHKTGKPPAEKVEIVGGGEHLQPVLYALAAERALNERVSGGRLFYATLKQNFAITDVPLHDASRRRAEQVVAEIDRALKDGFLPAAPRKNGCKGCEYAVVCGPWEEERVVRKSGPELKRLQDLRRFS